jgi:hypothetical protein
VAGLGRRIVVVALTVAELTCEGWSSGARRPGCRDFVRRLAPCWAGPLDLGRQWQRATGEVATWDDRAGLGRLDGHGLSTAGEV